MSDVRATGPRTSKARRRRRVEHRPRSRGTPRSAVRAAVSSPGAAGAAQRAPLRPSATPRTARLADAAARLGGRRLRRHRCGTAGAAATGRRVRHSRNPVDRLTRGLPDPAAGHDRLDRHDRRRDRDRAARQGVRRQPVPDPVVVDGADAALRPAASPAARRASPTACSRTGSSTACATRAAARSSSSRRRPRRRIKCGAGGTFVKRLIGLPGRHGRAQAPQRRRLRLHQREAAEGAVHPAVAPRRRRRASARSR